MSPPGVVVAVAQPRQQTTESAYESSLAPSEMERVSSLLLSLGFFSLEGDYRQQGLADGGWAVTEGTRDGLRKRVVNSNGAGPAALQAIEAEFKAVAARLAWRPMP